MHTIASNKTYELIVKSSRFIAILIKINDSSDIGKILDDIKKEYPNATHYCYAYTTPDYQKQSDDGEPSGTAGVPILNVLNKHNLVNILAVVVRYFGGIKLGAGGLVRAYSKSVSNAIKEAEIKELTKGYNVDITFSYDETNNVDYLLKDVKINNKIYTDKITYNIDISNVDILKNNHLEYKILKEIYIEK